MRISANFVLLLAALFFGLLLAPRARAQAHVADCPKEPETGASIVSGDTFSGPNCLLNTPGDIDGFSFGATAGNTYQIALGYQGGPTNVCFTLYDPSSVVVVPQTCTTSDGIAVQKTLTTTGTYNILVTEPAGAGQAVDAYALSLERINSFPTDAQVITLSKVIDDTISAPTEQNAFTFTGSTTGTYQVTLTYTGGAINACVYLYSPGTIVPNALSGCTSTDSYTFKFTPPQNATYMLLVNGAGNDATVSYNLEVSCLLGVCNQSPPPPCTLRDTATYNAATSTLTMSFTVGNTAAETWNAWLTYQNTLINLFSAAQPITTTPKVIVKTKTALAKEGEVGVLSTLTTPTGGITCQSWVLVNTGKP